MQASRLGDGEHNSSAPGFGQTLDPFAVLDRKGQADDDDDGLYFDDTYDGLGEQLDETGDAFNDDTFGTEPATQETVGKNFDFSGQTAKVTGGSQEEHVVYSDRQPARNASSTVNERPTKSGYEKYTEPTHIPQLEANASLWGITKKSVPHSKTEKRLSGHDSAAGKKIMSLEEVEAAMRAERKRTAVVELPQQISNAPAGGYLSDLRQQDPSIIMQRMQPNMQVGPESRQTMDPYGIMLQQSRGAPSVHGVSLSQAVRTHAYNQLDQQSGTSKVTTTVSQHPSIYNQPRQILQNPNRLSGSGQAIPNAFQGNPGQQQLPELLHRRGPSLSGQFQLDTNTLANMTEEERHILLMEEAKRAKRNHKIFLLSKDNGLMTPYDKNFISRIQLQQLVTATGNVNDPGSDSALSEDFYYQVYSQIRNAQRQTPNQPLNQFAQTYLFQIGNRHSATARRLNRVGDTHMQRMEQQIQRAVEVAKLRPKNKQLVIEGSLGKISFSNAKTPKPLLNIKRTEGAESRPTLGRTATTKADRKVVLRDIENLYDTLMSLEDHERNRPISGFDHGSPDLLQQNDEWEKTLQSLNWKLWQEIKVMAPIVPNSSRPHPFIAILSHTKGKKVISRIFRHLSSEQRLRILTLTVLHLDTLDVIQRAIPQPDGSLSRNIRESIDVFSQIVLPSLLTPVTDEPINIVIGLLGLLLDRAQVGLVIRSKVGLGILTMLVSRAELAKQSRGGDAGGSGTKAKPNNRDKNNSNSNNNNNNNNSWEEQWSQLYDRLFNQAEPFLPIIFPGKANEADDVHVWQFLATMAVGASPEQQQRLVIGVKDRIMETVAVSKTLPSEMASARLGHVNLFMRAIGLDVELLG